MQVFKWSILWRHRMQQPRLHRKFAWRSISYPYILTWSCRLQLFRAQPPMSSLTRLSVWKYNTLYTTWPCCIRSCIFPPRRWRQVLLNLFFLLAMFCVWDLADKLSFFFYDVVDLLEMDIRCIDWWTIYNSEHRLASSINHRKSCFLKKGLQEQLYLRTCKGFKTMLRRLITRSNWLSKDMTYWYSMMRKALMEKQSQPQRPVFSWSTRPLSCIRDFHDDKLPAHDSTKSQSPWTLDRIRVRKPRRR